MALPPRHDVPFRYPPPSPGPVSPPPFGAAPAAPARRRGRYVAIIAGVVAVVLAATVVALWQVREHRSLRNTVGADQPLPVVGSTPGVTTGQGNPALNKLVYPAGTATVAIDAPKGWYVIRQKFTNSGPDVRSAFKARQEYGMAQFGSAVWVGRAAGETTDLHQAANLCALYNAQHAYEDAGKLNVSTSRAVTVDGHAGWELTGTVTYSIPGVSFTSDDVYTLVVNFEVGGIVQIGYAVPSTQADDLAAAIASMRSVTIT